MIDLPQMYCSKCEKPCETRAKSVREVSEFWGERRVEYFTQFTSDCCDAELEEKPLEELEDE